MADDGGTRDRAIGRRGALGLALATSVHSAGRAASRVLSAVTEYPATSLPGEGLATFAGELASASQASLSVEPRYDAPEGLRATAILDSVAKGRIAIGDMFSGSIDSTDPLFGFSALPFLTTDARRAASLFDKARAAYERAFSARGQTLLYATVWPASGLWSRQPVVVPDDMKGLRVRSYDSSGISLFTAAGATAQFLSFSDLMPRLKDGSINAVVSSGDGGAGRRLWEFLPHFTQLDYSFPLSFTTMNQALYDTLDGAGRDAVGRASARTQAVQLDKLEAREARNLVVMRENGVTIHHPDPSLIRALTAASEPIVRDWARRAGPDAVTLVALAER